MSNIGIGTTADPVRPWFKTLESLGECVDIRIGRVDSAGEQVDWHLFSHREYDGIGAFVSAIRSRGVELLSLPEISHNRSSLTIASLQTLPQLLAPRKVLKWQDSVTDTAAVHKADCGPPRAYSWHVFSSEQSSALLARSRAAGVTLNSFLLKNLNAALSPFIESCGEPIPWMIPVNLRGLVKQQVDAANHSSYIAVRISPNDGLKEVHQKVYAKLKKGEHQANWQSYVLTKGLAEPIKKYLIESNRAMLQWNIGSFSNLGNWDPQCAIIDPYCAAPWLFVPPVLRCQLLGAGCITFQGKLSIMLQAHPELTVSKEIADTWLSSWIKNIDLETS